MFRKSNNDDEKRVKSVLSEIIKRTNILGTEDFITALTKLKNKISETSKNPGLIRQISAILDECDVFSSDWENKDKIPAFLGQIRNKLMSIAKNNDYSHLVINKECEDYYYSVLIEITKLSPFNNSESEKWICPISDKTTRSSGIDNSFVVLSTGYIYDKESLFTWFKKSKRFTDPVTNTPLPQFDIQRIIRFNEGLQKIAEIQAKYIQMRSELIEKQEKMNSAPDVHWRDAIKICFHVLTSHEYTQASRDQVGRMLQDLKCKHVMQKAPKTNDEIGKLGNFSMLDLSGLTFYNHYLTDPYKRGNSLDLRGANLSGCVFLGKCSTAECLHADLSEANLEGARFLNTPGGGICIKTTNFTDANLRNVDLTGVGNWGNVNLTNANLRGAYLYDEEGIKLTGPDLKRYLRSRDGVETAKFDPEPEPHICVDQLTQPATATANEEQRPSMRM